MPVANWQFVLQAVVSGPRGVLAVANVPEIAVSSPARQTGSSGCGARGDSRRNKRAEAVCNQPIKCRVRVDRLEVTDNAIAHVASLEDHAAGHLMLNAKRPALRVRLVEIRSDLRVVACARVNSTRDVTQMGCAYVRPQETGSREARRCTASGIDRASINNGRRGRHVQEHVVVGRVVGDAETATNYRFFPSQSEQTWFPGKADVGPEVLIVVRDLPQRCY